MSFLTVSSSIVDSHQIKWLYVLSRARRRPNKRLAIVTGDSLSPIGRQNENQHRLLRWEKILASSCNGEKTLDFVEMPGGHSFRFDFSFGSTISHTFNGHRSNDVFVFWWVWVCVFVRFAKMLTPLINTVAWAGEYANISFIYIIVDIVCLRSRCCVVARTHHPKIAHVFVSRIHVFLCSSQTTFPDNFVVNIDVVGCSFCSFSFGFSFYV